MPRNKLKRHRSPSADSYDFDCTVKRHKFDQSQSCLSGENECHWNTRNKRKRSVSQELGRYSDNYERRRNVSGISTRGGRGGGSRKRGGGKGGGGWVESGGAEGRDGMYDRHRGEGIGEWDGKHREEGRGGLDERHRGRGIGEWDERYRGRGIGEWDDRHRDEGRGGLDERHRGRGIGEWDDRHRDEGRGGLDERHRGRGIGEWDDRHGDEGRGGLDERHRGREIGEWNDRHGDEGRGGLDERHRGRGIGEWDDRHRDEGRGGLDERHRDKRRGEWDERYRGEGRERKERRVVGVGKGGLDERGRGREIVEWNDRHGDEGRGGLDERPRGREIGEWNDRHGDEGRGGLDERHGGREIGEWNDRHGDEGRGGLDERHRGRGIGEWDDRHRDEGRGGLDERHRDKRRGEWDERYRGEGRERKERRVVGVGKGGLDERGRGEGRGGFDGRGRGRGGMDGRGRGRGGMDGRGRGRWTGRRRGGRGRRSRGQGRRGNQGIAKPTDLAVQYAIGNGSPLLIQDIQCEDIQSVVRHIHELCQSPFRHCVYNVFSYLRDSVFFVRREISRLLMDIKCDTIKESMEDTASLIKDIVNQYCCFLDDTDSADASAALLWNISTLKDISTGETRRITSGVKDSKRLRSRIDVDVDTILPPSISSLYHTERLHKRYITHPFENKREFLNRTFHVHKEDFVRPIVQGLKRFKQFLLRNKDVEHFQDDDIRVYRELHIIRSAVDASTGLVWDIQLDSSQPLVRSIIDKNRKLLQTGTQVCLSNDFFQKNICHGTVVGRTSERNLLKEEGIITVQFPRSFCERMRLLDERFTLVESRTNCLANIGALCAVKIQMDENRAIPFEEQLVYHRPNIDPPGYLCPNDLSAKHFSLQSIISKGLNCGKSNPTMKQVNDTDPRNSTSKECQVNEDNVVIVRRIESPDIRIESPDIRIERPDIKIESPDIRMESPDIRIERPDIRIESPDIRIESPDIRIESPDIRTESSDIKIESPDIRIESPDIRIESPDIKIESPDIRIESPDIRTESSDIKIESPDIRIESPDIEIESPDIRIERPDIKIESPDIKIESPDIRMESPDIRIERPDIRIESPDIRTESADIRIESPDSRTESPDIRIERPGIKIESPDIRIESPDIRIESPDIRMESPDIRIERPDIRIERPDIRMESPDMKIESPDIRLEGPDIRIESPDRRTESPDIKIERPDIKIESPDIRIESPDIRMESPDIRIESPDIRTESSDIRIESPDSRTESPDIRIERPGIKIESPDIRIESPDIRIESHDVTIGGRANMPLVNIANIDNWPKHNDLGMDTSQYKAFVDALTHGLALIQGPPGTGKTVMALKIIEIFLNNTSIWNKNNVGPIILLSYTNHAVDQFLEGISKMPNMDYQLGDIIRVGSRCQIECLDQFNLTHCRRKQSGSPGPWMMRQEEEEHAQMASAFEIYRTSLVHECFLRQMGVIPDHIYYSLVLPAVRNLPADKTRLCEWLYLSSHQEGTSADMEIDCSFDEEGELDISMEQTYNRTALHPQAIVTKETEEDRQKGFKYWSSINRKDKIAMLQGIKSRILKTHPMSKQEEERVDNVWDLKVQDRWKLYKRWIWKILVSLEKNMFACQMAYQNKYRIYQECRQSADIAILKNAKIVAMTTTRAARDHEILRMINSKIMVIEEAAEVPNHHLLASMVPSLEHLIMIGDHQQLKPSYNDYRTARKYDLNVSIFERLISTGIGFQRLQYQHRMRPEISDLLTPYIYKDLNNHESVMKIDDVRGIMNNVFFLNHMETEDVKLYNDTKSPTNQHEVNFIVQLYRYLRLQGYSSKDVTVLTTYMEQSRKLKMAIRRIEEEGQFVEPLPCPVEESLDVTKNKVGSCPDTAINALPTVMRFGQFSAKGEQSERTTKGAHVTTVDNFQGEESKIILLSLVRSNCNGTIGFLKESNRICVALSRAKAGMYVIGNCTMLQNNNKLWLRILNKAESKGFVGEHLVLFCKNHPHHQTKVSKGSDFETVPYGGCHLPCEYKRRCGHTCPLQCHGDDPDHTLRHCMLICEKVVCPLGHKCQSECYKCTPACPPCTHEVEKILPKCGHTANVLCSMDPEQFKCTQRCCKILPCGHRCQRRCSEECNTTENCNELIKIKSDCGHEIQVACYTSTQGNHQCTVPCSHILRCRHVCTGTCYSCFGGQLHQPCQIIKTKFLLCGHDIKAKCVVKNISCFRKPLGACRHISEQGLCRDTNTVNCDEQCEWRCKVSCRNNFKCTGNCFEPCTRPMCDTRCSYTVSACDHWCSLLSCERHEHHWCQRCHSDQINSGLIGENVFSRSSRFMKLGNCGCVFEVAALDKYMAVSTVVLKMKRCPNCKKVITDARYNRIHKTQRERIRVATLLAATKNENIDQTRQRVLNKLSEDKSLGCTWRDRALSTELKARLSSTRHIQEVLTIDLQTKLIDMLEAINITYLYAKCHISDKSFQRKYEHNLKHFFDWLVQIRQEFSRQELEGISAFVKTLMIQVKSGILNSSLNPGVHSRQLMTLVGVCMKMHQGDTSTKWDEIATLVPELAETAESLAEDVRVPVDITHYFQSAPLLEGSWLICPNGHVFPKQGKATADGQYTCGYC